MPTFVNLDDARFNVDDLTLDECITVEREAGVTWLELNPFASARQAKAVVGAVARRLGKKDTLARLGNMKATDVIDLLEYVAPDEVKAEDDLPSEFVDGIPKAEDGPTTS